MMKEPWVFNEVLDSFHPYFEDLKLCVSDLRDEIMSHRGINHRAMCKILREAFESLPDHEEMPEVSIDMDNKESSC